MKAIIFLCIAALLTFHSTASGQAVSQMASRSIADFTGISVQGNYTVFIAEGDSFIVKIDAPAEILDRVVTVVKNGVLKIHNKHDNWSMGVKSWYSGKNWWHHHPEIVIYVTVRKLKNISSAGSTKIYFNDGLGTGDINLRLLGSGVMEGKITAMGSLKTRLSGSANLKLSGIAKNANIRLSGSASFDAANLVTENASVHILGSGHATVNASETVTARLYGSSALDYYGSAKINSKKFGSAAISKL